MSTAASQCASMESRWGAWRRISDRACKTCERSSARKRSMLRVDIGGDAVDGIQSARMLHHQQDGADPIERRNSAAGNDREAGMVA